MTRKRRTYEELRKLIVEELSKGERTVNQLSEKTGLTWRTVNHHLIYLIGTDIVEPVLITAYVKIYKLKGDEP